MGLCGPLSCSPSESLDNNIIANSPASSEHDCEYSIVTINESFTKRILPSCSNTVCDNTSDTCQRARPKKSVTVAYGPIQVVVRQTKAPTLATGRRSKFVPLEGDEARKREIRRKRNRDAAKKLKEKRALVEQQLLADIKELECKEQELLWKITRLESHKQQLELQCQNVCWNREKLVQTTAPISEQIEYQQLAHHTMSIDSDDIHVKEEERSSTPQWQLLFSI